MKYLILIFIFAGCNQLDNYDMGEMQGYCRAHHGQVIRASPYLTGEIICVDSVHVIATAKSLGLDE